MRDVWSIFFLDMEKLALHISDQLVPKLSLENLINSNRAQCSVDGLGDEALSVFEVHPDSSLVLVSGKDLNLKHLSDLLVSRQSELASWNLLVLEDQVLSAVLLPLQKSVMSGGAYEVHRLAFATLNRKIDVGVDPQKTEMSLVYIASRQGKLIYSNRDEVNQKNFLKRNLVQKFIELPVWQGLLDIVDGIPVYGFFMEIPGTNLVIFAEISQRYVIEQVSQVTRKLLYVVILSALVVLGGLFLAVSRLLKPVSDISAVALSLAQGHFEVEAAVSGVGEVRVLTESFQTMIRGLKERDKKIHELAQEQIERVRLASELAVAKRIQGSLLTEDPLPRESGLVLSAIYRPASEVAGDWYGYFYHDETRESVIVIVDVSGHGAGSSMFTTIAAAMFEEYRTGYAENPNCRSFFKKLNHQLIRYGKLEWSATTQVLIYKSTECKLEIYNAGHPKPFWIAPGSDVKFASMSLAPSTPLGYETELSVAEFSTDFKRGQMCLIYTDGLSEMRDPDQKSIGARKLLKVLSPQTSPEQAIADVLRAAEKHAHGTPQEDDICIIALKCTS